MKNLRSSLLLLLPGLPKRAARKKRAGLSLVKRALALLLAVCTFVSGCKVEVLKPELDIPFRSDAETGGAESAGEDFTICVIPDTQYYTASLNGGTPAMMAAQMDWIKANREAENIVYVAGVGDISEYGDNNNSEWVNATSNGWYRLETPVTGLPHGIPYGVAVGNHDQSPYALRGHPLSSSTAKFNQYFGRNHFAGRAYYGNNRAGASSNNNDCHYDLFSAGGVDFIVIYLEFDSENEDWNDANQWAQDMLTIYRHRKGIIVTHDLMNAGVGTAFNPQGGAVYNRIKYRTNCFLMLSGHTGPQGRRADTYNSNTINTIMQDYQAQANGGGGVMRVMRFSVTNNTLYVRTLNAVTGVFRSLTNSNDTFTLPLFSTPYVQPTILQPVEDAYVRDGSHANSNFGTTAGIVIKHGSTSYSRKAFFKFNLASAPGFSRAVLKVYGSNIESTGDVDIKSYYAATDSWTESGITWNNAPVAYSIGAMPVNHALRYYEWDVTAYVQGEAAGDGIASIVLHQTAGGNLTTTWHSRESANPPQLVLYQ